MFELLVESTSRKRTNTGWGILISTVVQIALIGVLVLIPLLYTDTITATMLTTLLTAPAPPPPAAPPPPPPTVVKIVKPTARLIQAGKLVAPQAIPKNVNIIKEEAPPPDAAVGVQGGVPGGVPGGQVSGVLGGIIGGVSSTAAPPPPPKEAPKRIPVGGNVQMANLIHQVQPLYPPLARQAHIQGTVVLHAIISKDGTIQELKVISGPALLIQAALDAVKQWRYRPTLLNTEPVEVDTTISVIFTLGG